MFRHEQEESEGLCYAPVTSGGSRTALQFQHTATYVHAMALPGVAVGSHALNVCKSVKVYTIII